MTNQSSRIEWLDVSKGLAIMAVVLSHSGHPLISKYLFWFHMPIFFIISGILFKPLKNWSDFKPWLRKRTVQLLVPYLTFLLLTFLINIILDLSVGTLTLNSFTEELMRTIAGGRFIVGINGAHWFITCFYFTSIVFALLHLFIKSDKVIIGIVIFMYILAHVESQIAIETSIFIPWNLDVVLLSSAYYALGYYGKAGIKKINIFWFFILSGATLLFVVWEKATAFDYRFDMKLLTYNHLLLDFLVPVVISILVFSTSKILSQLKLNRLIASVGTRSLVIMYLHLPLNILILNPLGTHYVLKTFLGIVVPIAISKFILEKYDATRFLFLGASPNKQKEVIETRAA